MTNQEWERIEREFVDIFDWLELQYDGKNYVPTDKIKQFLKEQLEAAEERGREQSRIILIKVLAEVEKEHGSKNVYLDMVEELFTEEIITPQTK